MGAFSPKRPVGVAGTLLICCLALAGPVAAHPPLATQAETHACGWRVNAVIADRSSVAEALRGITCLINFERKRHGMRPLRMTRPLMRAGQHHANDMQRHGYFGHRSRTGRTPQQRIADTGYLHDTWWWRIGEDLAWAGYDWATPGGLFSQLMHSRTHRRELLVRRFTDIGVGIALGTPQPGYARGATLAVDLGFAFRGAWHWVP